MRCKSWCSTVVVPFLFFASFLPLAARAQEKGSAVKGIVQGSKKEPLAGVSVIIRNNKTNFTSGTSTDTTGMFSFAYVPTGGPYSFSFSMVGYEPQTLTGYNIKDDAALSLLVEMKSVSQMLDQVVVVGYGTQRKRDVTGSVARVKAEELNAYPVNNPVQGLQGRVSGVQVTQNSGEPGGYVSVRIRGGNSLQGSNEPLYVVDGFALSGPPSAINPNDIESMDILKDASATAIYGSRGANGVVLITTKAGRTGKTQISFDTYYGVQQVAETMDLMNAKEFALLANERATNDNVPAFFTQDQINSFGEGTDWQDELFRKAPIQNHGLTVSGGSENTQFSVSANYFKQDGIIKGSDYQRTSIRGTLNQKISNKVRLTYNTILSHTDRSSLNVNNGQKGGTVMSGIMVAPPTVAPFDSAANYSNVIPYGFSPNELENPLANAVARQDKIRENYILAGLAFTYEPIKGLLLKSSVGVENNDGRRDLYSPSVIRATSTGLASISNFNTVNFLNENTATYTRTSGNHNFSFLGGVTYQSETFKFDSSSATGFSTDLLTTNALQSGNTPGVPSSSLSKWVLASYLGRVNYSFKNRYLFTASLRADGSSRFGESNKWGYFPSAAFAWRVFDESFMKNIDFISDLKLRLSWGSTGNTGLSPYQTLLTLSPVQTIFSNQIAIGFLPGTTLSNPNLKWESTEATNIGLDIGLLKNRIFLTLDYYKKNTRDLLATVPLETSSGYSNTVMNIGEIQNSGIELGINASPFNKKFKWDISANISRNRNKVVELAKGSDVFGAAIGQPLAVAVNLVRVGEPVGVFYGYLEDGLTDQGAIKYVDVNKDGTINLSDKTIIGDPNADFLFGFNSRMSFKNFDLTFFIQGMQGGDIFNVNPSSIGSSFYFGENQLKEVFDNHWSPANPDPHAKYPKISAATKFLESDRYVEDASYVRLKNILLAYNVPVSKFGISWFKRLRVYVSAQNLVTLTDYSGFDPEVSTRGGSNSISIGIDQTGYPTAKTYTIGANLDSKLLPLITKNIEMKKLFIFLSLALLFASCSKMLEEKPEDRLFSAGFYKSSKDAVSAVNAIYAPLRLTTYMVSDGPWYIQPWKIMPRARVNILLLASIKDCQALLLPTQTLCGQDFTELSMLQILL
jgi:TonB-linked SusC/RagA family outer membrane protein